jgi:hypothetical protein
MPIFSLANKNTIAANLAQRLLQVCCIILYSMLRLISSDNVIASIMAMIPVSTRPSIIGDHVHSVSLARLRCDIGRSLLYDIAQRTAWPWHEPKESLFSWRRDPGSPLPHAPMRVSSQCGNPSPHKNCLFVCQYSLLTSLMSYAIPNVVC